MGAPMIAQENHENKATRHSNSCFSHEFDNIKLSGADISSNRYSNSHPNTFANIYTNPSSTLA